MLTSELVLSKILATWISFAAIYFIYIIMEHKPFLYPYFWRTIYYVSIWAAFLLTSIFILPLRFNAFTTLLLWSCIVFFGYMVILNIYVSNFNPEKFEKIVNSRTIGLSIALLIGLEFVAVSIIELFIK